LILGDQGDFWYRGDIPINSAINYQVVFEGVRGSDYQGDIAIDDISFTPGCKPDSTATIIPGVVTPTPPSGCTSGQTK